MRMKSFFAPSVQDAVEQARVELGPEALLVNSRKAPPEARGMGEYEVVFAVLPGAGQEHASDVAGAPAQGAPSAEDPVLHELARLRRQIGEMGNALNEINAQSYSWAVPAPEFAEALSRLMDSGFSVDVAKRVVKLAHARLDGDPTIWPRRKTFDRESVDHAIRMELERLVLADAGFDNSGKRPHILALVGAPGSGKTATLVKLAVRLGVRASRPVHLISADTNRVGAADQLRTYAAIIGATFDSVDTTRGLEQAIEANREKGLILIDTPGYAAAEIEEAAELAHFLAQHSAIEVQLVAPASMRAADLSGVIDRFEIFSPSKLIFTRLDETSAWGGVIGESIRTEKPISFLSTGQQIPEDLEPATAERLLERVLERGNERAIAAA